MGVVAVTGSAGGLGSVICARLEAEGHRVVGVDIVSADVTADLCTRAGRSAAVEGVMLACEGRLDALVVGAGLGPTATPVDRIVRVNYFGAVEMLDGLADALFASAGAGHQPAAVAICSNSATLLPPSRPELVDRLLAGDEDGATTLADGTDGAALYAMSKLALGRAIRRRCVAWGERRVRLNAVAPGPVLTPLLQASLDDPRYGQPTRDLPVPMGRIGEPADVAAAVWWLLSPAATWVHGTVLFVDGGTDAMFRPDVF
jgi:NAD(P)-dependent dehydrogenase (short-subunit alcohol dehydrogenase family)